MWRDRGEGVRMRGLGGGREGEGGGESTCRKWKSFSWADAGRIGPVH